VALFVGGDGSTETLQYIVSARPGKVRGVAVWDGRGALLEASVDEAEVFYLRWKWKLTASRRTDLLSPYDVGV
jgi:hypothetical protein